MVNRWSNTFLHGGSKKCLLVLLSFFILSLLFWLKNMRTLKEVFFCLLHDNVVKFIHLFISLPCDLIKFFLILLVNEVVWEGEEQEQKKDDVSSTKKSDHKAAETITNRLLLKSCFCYKVLSTPFHPFILLSIIAIT